jgi:hypothetical protein
MSRIRFFGWLLLINATFAFVSANVADAQSLVLRIAEHQKVKEDRNYIPDFVALDQKPSYGFEFYLHSILKTKRAYRFGIGLSSFSVKSKLKEPYSEIPVSGRLLDFRLTTLSVRFQRKIFGEESVYFLGGVSAGVCFKKAEFEVSTYYFRDDYVCFSFQPGFCYVLRIYRNIGIQLSGRYNFLTGRKQDLYPFSPGFLAEGGLLFELPIGEL